MEHFIYPAGSICTAAFLLAWEQVDAVWKLMFNIRKVFGAYRSHFRRHDNDPVLMPFGFWNKQCPFTQIQMVFLDQAGFPEPQAAGIHQTENHRYLKMPQPRPVQNRLGASSLKKKFKLLLCKDMRNMSLHIFRCQIRWDDIGADSNTVHIPGELPYRRKPVLIALWIFCRLPGCPCVADLGCDL